jgi:hypothetical protein
MTNNPTHFSATIKGTRQIYLMGSFGDFYSDPTPVSLDVSVSLLEDSPSLTYEKLAFSLPEWTWSVRRFLKAGLGNKGPEIELKIESPAVMVSPPSLGPFRVQAGIDALHYVARSDESNKTIFPQELAFDFTGKYTLTGPTQAQSGSFSKPRTVYVHNDNPPWKLDLTSFPKSVSLVSRHLIQWNSLHAPPLIEQTVDGVPIVVTTGGEHWEFGSRANQRTGAPASRIVLNPT